MYISMFQTHFKKGFGWILLSYWFYSRKKIMSVIGRDDTNFLENTKICSVWTEYESLCRKQLKTFQNSQQLFEAYVW